MPINDTNLERFITRFGHEPQDHNGTTISLGDTVSIIRDMGGHQQGDIATVVSFYTNGDRHSFPTGVVGIEFHEPKGVGTEYLDGFAPSGQGLLIQGKDIERGNPVISEEDSKLVEEAIDIATLGGQTAFLNGKFFNLEMKENTEANKLLEPIVVSFSRNIGEIKRKAAADLAREVQKNANRLSMPHVTKNDIIRGMRFWYYGEGVIMYALPLHYAPKYITTKYGVPTHIISEEHQEELKADCMFVVGVDKAGNFFSAGTYKDNLETAFIHYHGSGNACMGTVDVNQKIAIPNGIYELRDRYEKALIGVTEDSLNHEVIGEGRPTFPILKANAKKIKEGDEGVWASYEEGERIVVGDMVEVTAFAESTEIGKDIIGAIGRVIGIHRTTKFLVEFLFNIPVLGGKTLYVPVAEVKKCPENTRRTRKPMTQTNNPAATTEATTRIEPFMFRV